MFDLSDVADLLAAHAAAHPKKSSSREPRALWTYDTETDGFHNCEDPACEKCQGVGRVPKPFLHGLYDGEADHYEEFEEVEEVVEFTQDKRAMFYAHNGGKFADYHSLRPYMNTDEAIRLINGRIAEFRIGEAVFRDSLNIFPNTRLADFGVKNEIDYEKMEPGIRDIPAVRREISLYLRQDCKGLWDQVARFRREYGTNLTQAGTMMKLWEKKYYGQKAPRQTKTQFERCRPFYYGGRVQCFESGIARTRFRLADINSAYPRAMLERHPISPDCSESRHLPRDQEALQTALIQLRCTARGCFPWRDENRELYFPEDEGGHRAQMRRYCVTGWEFLAALETDAVTNIQIERVLTFAQAVSFKDYILPAYEARMKAKESGDLAGAIFGKYQMNGVYGKFGADPSNYSDYVIATVDSYETWCSKGFKRYQDWGEGKWLMERGPTEDELQDLKSKWRYYNVATAASITGYVRANLFRALSASGGVIYCDTDSIAAREMSSLDYGKGLGQWKDEGSFDRYAIAGKKLYAFHQSGAALDYDPKAKTPTWKVASKGVNFQAIPSGRKDAQGKELPSGPDMIAALARGETVVHLPQVPTYSITREQPAFIKRSITRTSKDIRIAPH